MGKKKKASLGCLFWIALILLVLVVFFFNRERINTVIEETGFKDYVFKEQPQEPEVKRVEPEKEDPSTTQEKDEKEEDQQDESIKLQDSPKKPDSEVDSDEEDEKEGDDQDVEITVDKDTPDEAEKPLVDKRMRKSALYFVEVNDNGTIELKKIIRPVYYNESPLTETLKALLEGLTSEELNQGLLNLIPQNTKIQKVWVENGTAYIDFNEALRFNQFGKEGLQAELQQIVYTATEFQTVDSVQILINGKKREYLSSEGIFVGKPLSRNDV